MTELADRAEENGPRGTRGVRLCGDEELGPWLLGRCAAPPLTAGVTGVWLACVRAYGDAPPACYAEAEAEASRWLPLVWEPGALLVGPAGLPGEPGCPRCAWLRRRRNVPLPSGSGGPPHHAPPAGPVLDAAGALLAGELGALAALLAPAARGETAPPPRTRGALFRVGTGRGVITRHPVLPDPACERCGPLLPAADLDPLPGRSRAHTPGALRTLTGADVAERAARFVDPYVGLVHEVRERAEGGRPVAVAVREPARDGTETGHAPGHGYGHGSDFRTAASTAVLEALERLGGEPTPAALARRGPTASYRAVAGHAVHPPAFGLHPDASYDRPGFPYVRWSAARETDWAWGRSLTRDRPVLVPAGLAHHADPRPACPRFVQELSNGCALGGSLTEAVLHGLLEVAERDAFLATWYARLPLARIDLDSAPDRRIPLLAAWARERAGRDLMAFDATLEQGVPAVWAMAVARPGAEGRPAAVCGGAARLRAEDALRAALDELVCTLLAPSRHDGERAAALLRDPFAVRGMPDHGLLYAQPEAYGRLSFLRTDGDRVPVARLEQAHPWPRSTDLAEHVRELVRRYAEDGMEVIVVDQTRPEHRSAGLRCVKVLVPGTLPMTYGHAFRRLTGLPRVRTLPRTLGFRADALTEGEINPHPHPFP
ncbi:TOMM precursor leader peptide-binding protein [Streptomyces sp. NPDC048172]|uniref:TOMM precursor leader peptide-binding protein n=1 Tax=Streptomyces sp. NPDC048172 TaxID=3365505 RepID=UPI00370F82BB